MTHRRKPTQPAAMRFWFEPTAPDNLGLCRIVFYGLLLWLTWNISRPEWASVSPALWMPMSITRLLRIPLVSTQALEIVGGAFLVSVFLSAIGFRTRLSTIVAFVTGAYLFWLPNNFGKINHSSAILIFALGILAVSRCGDAYSVDRLIWRRAGQSHSPEYLWPVRLIQVLMTLVFFGAGVSKLRRSGLDWIFSDNLRILFIKHHYLKNPPTNLGLYLAQYPLLYQTAALSTVLMETLSPLALFSRRAKLLIIPGLLLFQLGNYFIIGVSFMKFLPCYMFWVPWESLVARLRHISASLKRVPDERS